MLPGAGGRQRWMSTCLLKYSLKYFETGFFTEPEFCYYRQPPGSTCLHKPQHWPYKYMTPVSHGCGWSVLMLGICTDWNISPLLRKLFLQLSVNLEYKILNVFKRNENVVFKVFTTLIINYYWECTV